MKKQDQKIELVNGEFTPTQAADIIISLINQKINYHKIKRFQMWESNHESDLLPLNNRIEELEQEKKTAIYFIEKMRLEGAHLKINGIINMTSCEP
jgi:hypothetical protein